MSKTRLPEPVPHGEKVRIMESSNIDGAPLPTDVCVCLSSYVDNFFTASHYVFEAGKSTVMMESLVNHLSSKFMGGSFCN